MPNYALYGRSNVGTPMMLYSLEMALWPGMSEDTEVGILTKALVYWQLNNHLLYATTAIGWIQAELTRIENPPANTLRSVVPV